MTDDRGESAPHTPIAADPGRVWHLLHAGPPAAQSNTAGRGHLEPGTSGPVDPMVFQFGFHARRISPATEDLDMNETRITGKGPIVGFARQAVETGHTDGNPILVLPAARGGTRLATDDHPTWRSAVRGSLWDDWWNLRQDAIREIEERGEKWTDFAAISIHGESDGDALCPGDAYRTDYDANIVAMRACVGEQMPLLIAAMVPEHLSTGTRAEIRDVQATAPDRHQRVFYVESPWGAHLGDGNHFSGEGAEEIGARLFAVFAGYASAGPRS